LPKNGGNSSLLRPSCGFRVRCWSSVGPVRDGTWGWRDSGGLVSVHSHATTGRDTQHAHMIVAYPHLCQLITPAPLTHVGLSQLWGPLKGIRERTKRKRHDDSVCVLWYQRVKSSRLSRPSKPPSATKLNKRRVRSSGGTPTHTRPEPSRPDKEASRPA